MWRNFGEKRRHFDFGHGRKVANFCFPVAGFVVNFAARFSCLFCAYVQGRKKHGNEKEMVMFGAKFG